MIPLPQDAVHVWRVRQSEVGPELDQLASLLAADERRRAERFHSARRRRTAVVSRGLLRQILGRYLGRPAASIRFGQGPFGKPVLTGAGEATDLRFNVAHSGDFLFYAVARGREVGIDLERLRPLKANGVVKGILSPRELATYEGLPEERRARAFFTCWVRKEALVKAWGTGLQYTLNRLSVSIVPEEPPRLLEWERQGVHQSQWCLFDLPTVTEYVAALAVSGSDAQIVLRHWCTRDAGLRQIGKASACGS